MTNHWTDATIIIFYKGKEARTKYCNSISYWLDSDKYCSTRRNVYLVTNVLSE